MCGNAEIENLKTVDNEYLHVLIGFATKRLALGRSLLRRQLIFRGNSM